MYDLTKPVIIHQEPANRRERRLMEKEVSKKEQEISKLIDLFNTEIIEDRTPSWSYERVYQAYKGVYIRLLKQINQKSKFSIGNTRFFENLFKPTDGTFYYVPGWYRKLLTVLRNGLQS